MTTSRLRSWFDRHPVARIWIVVGFGGFLVIYSIAQVIGVARQGLVAPVTLGVEVMVTAFVVAGFFGVVRLISGPTKKIAGGVATFIAVVAASILGLHRYRGADNSMGPPAWRAPAAVILICASIYTVIHVTNRLRQSVDASENRDGSPLPRRGGHDQQSPQVDHVMVTPRELIASATFSFKLRGYSVKEVDGFIEAVRTSLPTDVESSSEETVKSMFTPTPPIDGNAIRSKEFMFSLRGYATTEVDLFLEQLATAVDNQTR